jgi:hypothetical protein
VSAFQATAIRIDCDPCFHRASRPASICLQTGYAIFAVPPKESSVKQLAFGALHGVQPTADIANAPFAG